jgi:hypothetical protein
MAQAKAHGAWRHRQKGLMLGKAIDIIIGLREAWMLKRPTIRPLQQLDACTPT